MMKKKRLIGFWATVAVVLLAMNSCRPQKEQPQSRLVGHWGCEPYVSCRTDSFGVEQWDTLHYAVGTGLGCEVDFYANGSGRLRLNDSPAMIKEFTCDYDYDSVSQTLTISNTLWIISASSDVTSADMAIEKLTDTTIEASWTNRFSEPEPFFERFFLKRID